MRPQRHAALITGCDTGFGNLLARKLDGDGFKVYACCLFPDGEGAKQLKADCSGLLQIVKLDVTKDEDVDEAYKRVDRDLELSGYREYCFDALRCALCRLSSSCLQIKIDSYTDRTIQSSLSMFTNTRNFQSNCRPVGAQSYWPL